MEIKFNFKNIKTDALYNIDKDILVINGQQIKKTDECTDKLFNFLQTVIPPLELFSLEGIVIGEESILLHDTMIDYEKDILDPLIINYFNHPLKVKALQKNLDLNIFDVIESNKIEFSVKDKVWTCMNDIEIKEMAADFFSDHTMEQSLEDKIGSADYLSNYDEFFDITEVIETINKEKGTNIEIMDFLYIGDLYKYVIENKIFEDGDEFLEFLDEESLFDNVAYAIDYMSDMDYALDYLEGFYDIVAIEGLKLCSKYFDSIVIFETN